MADNTQRRSFPLNDPYRHDPSDSYGRDTAAQSAGNGQGNDPLAELARLIGQNDPFAQFNRDSTRAASRQAAAAPAPDTDWQERAHSRYESSRWHDERGGHTDDAYAAKPSQTVDDRYYPPSTGDYAQPAAQSDHHYDRGYYDEQPFSSAGRGYENAPQGYASSAYASQDQDTQQYATQHQGYAIQQSYDNDPYYRDEGSIPASPQQYQEYDDAAPARRRGGMTVVMAILGLAVVGTAGAYGYRTMFAGGSGSTSQPPVITADKTPPKVVPAQNEGSSKLIQDRIGDRGQNEQVVSREEQPVNVRQAAGQGRSAFPDPNGVATSPFPPPPGSGAMASASPGAAPGTEPKRVRTLTIRPDQADPTPTGRTGTSGSAASTNAANARTAGRPTAPLPLNADSAQPSQMRTAAVTGPGSRPGGSDGAYSVQVSSQRSEADAQSSYRALQAKFPGPLGGRQAIIRRADLGDKGVYYRAMVGPFGTIEQASELCGSLKAAGGQCIVQRN